MNIVTDYTHHCATTNTRTHTTLTFSYVSAEVNIFAPFEAYSSDWEEAAQKTETATAILQSARRTKPAKHKRFSKCEPNTEPEVLPDVKPYRSQNHLSVCNVKKLFVNPFASMEA